MKSDHQKMLATLGEGYIALLAASAEVGGMALKHGLAESKQIARASAQALRAPSTERQGAIENVLVCAYDAQQRQMRAMRGAASLFGMSFLSYFEASRRR